MIKKYLKEFAGPVRLAELLAVLVLLGSLLLTVLVTMHDLGEEKMELIISIAGGLVVMVIGGVIGYFFRGKTYEKKLDSAPMLYADHLSRLIQQASESGGSEMSVMLKLL